MKERGRITELASCFTVELLTPINSPSFNPELSSRVNQRSYWTWQEELAALQERELIEEEKERKDETKEEDDFTVIE